MDLPLSRAHAGSGRLQPQEHPGPLRRPDPARLRVRPRRRRRLRPRLLPQPPGAQGDPPGPAIAGGQAAIRGADRSVLEGVSASGSSTGSWRTDDLVPRAIEHTAACLLARVDGKSPVEYLDPTRSRSAPGAWRIDGAAMTRPRARWDAHRCTAAGEGWTMITLKALKARQVLDSRGRPTVEVDAIASTGRWAGPSSPRGPAPAGTRRSSCATADSPRYGGLGVCQAVGNVIAGDRPGRGRHGPRRSSGARREADRARRHAEQGPAGGQCAPRRLAGRGPRRGRRAGRGAVRPPQPALEGAARSRSEATASPPSRRSPCRWST